jgi:[glutamine synthetase] adenylyltransferase / [glutamine synthetase]-adenylyl-L-tyrosine phosphorylase
LIEAKALSRYFRRTQPQLARWQAPSTATLSEQLHKARRAAHGSDDINTKSLRAHVQALLNDAEQRHALPHALRITRQALQCALVEHDCAATENPASALDATTATLSTFAELACERASEAACATLSERFPRPSQTDGAAQPLLVAGMGKLGAGELNASSDIDLVFLHLDDGDTSGMSHHEWFSRAARHTAQMLNEATEYGFVFRVDTRLRPNGDEGPSVCSFGMLDQYFTAQGRPWERFAWLRARLLGHGKAVPTLACSDWQQVVLPFVYRRYADFGMVESLRALHANIRTDAKARALRNPAASRDVKRSRGGIRELEFFVQLLQLVRGGVAPELRERHTRRAIARLCAAGIVEKERAAQLDAAYTFLRALENRIQYLDDAQTHSLPTDDADLECLAHAMGEANVCELLCKLDEHREHVASAFDSLLLTLGADTNQRTSNNGCRTCGGSASNKTKLEDTHTPTTYAPDAAYNARNEHYTNSSISDNARISESVNLLMRQPGVVRLSAPHHLRLSRIVQRSERFVQEENTSDHAALIAAFEAWLEWLSAHASRTNYLAFFDEHPQAAERLMRLFSVCGFAARYVRRFPSVVDELLAPQATERFDARAYEALLTTRLNAIEAEHANDVEPLLDALRRAHQLETFRLVLRDTELKPPVEEMSDDITALAETTLQTSLQACWRSFALKHRATPQFAVIGYGKLGSKELGYSSDLDLVLIYDDDDASTQDVGAVYTQFAKRWINWLTAHTGSGKLFDIDTRLRPNGNAGLLVTSLEAFERYQLGRGDNTAWTWEHQALTKARAVAGSVKIGEAFEAIRCKVLRAERDTQALATEVKAMREKMHAAHTPQAGVFDIKHDSGGLVDAEFALQYWILSHAHAQKALTANTGTIALLGVCADLGLITHSKTQAAQQAYRKLRAEQHRLKLAGAQYAQVPDDQFKAERAAIKTIYDAALGSSAQKV